MVCSRSEEGVHQGRGLLDMIGDVLIRGLWEIQTEAIIYIRLGWGTQTMTTTRIIQLKCSWFGRKNKIRTRTVSFVTRNRNIFLHLFLLLASCLERGPGRTCKFKSTDGKENRRTHFSCAWMDQWF